MKTTMEDITKNERINIEKYFEILIRLQDKAFSDKDMSTISAIKSLLTHVTQIYTLTHFLMLLIH